MGAKVKTKTKTFTAKVRLVSSRVVAITGPWKFDGTPQQMLEAVLGKEEEGLAATAEGSSMLLMVVSQHASSYEGEPLTADYVQRGVLLSFDAE